MTEVEDVVNKSLLLAEKYRRERKPGRSFAHLLIVLKLKPQWKDKLETFFISVLCDWEKFLEAEGRFSDLFSSYEQAFEHYKHHILYNNFGNLLYRLNYKKEAIQYFRHALNINNEYIPSLKNVYNLYNELVERWHFRMLNDDKRNNCFRKAVCNKIRKGHKTILDIGTGTGLLSVYAHIEGSENIYACDYSEIMIDIANQVISNNVNTNNSLKLIPKISNDISIPDDMPSRCSLVVTETLDAAIFGERILQTLIHAWENLLLPNTQLVGVCGEVIPQGAILYVTAIQCIKIARMNYVLGKERGLENVIKLGNFMISCQKNEPYDTENLRRVQHDCLSQPVEIFKINFNNIKDLKHLINGNKNLKGLNIHLGKEGFIDAFAIWFDLFLDENVSLSSSPSSSSDNCCWDQAIFPLNKVLIAEKNSLVSVNVTCTDGELKVTLPNINNPKEIITAPQEVIRFLNCISLQTVYQNAINDIKHSQLSVKISNMLDLSPFPVMGFMFAQNQLLVNVTSVIEIDKFPQILCENSIKCNFVNIGWNEFISSLENTTVQFDIIVLNYLLSTGEFNEDVINNLPKIRKCLKANAIIIPSQMNIRCQLIYSEQLISETEVINPLLMSEINLAEYINFYKVPYHIDFRMDEINYTKLSKEFTIGQLNIETLSTEENIIFEKEIEISETEGGVLNAILCWFDLNIYNYIFSTSSNDSYINHTAWFINPPITVKKSERIKIRALYRQSFLYFSTEHCKTVWRNVSNS